MAIDWETILVGTIVGTITIIITVPISMLLKDWLKRKIIVRELNKAGNIVGVGGEVLRGGHKYKIDKINAHGVHLKGEFQTVFVPLPAWLQGDIYLPDAEYEKKLIDYMEREYGQIMEVMMPLIINQTRDALIQEFESGGFNELDAAIKAANAEPVNELPESKRVLYDHDKKTDDFKVIGDRAKD